MDDLVGADVGKAPLEVAPVYGAGLVSPLLAPLEADDCQVGWSGARLD